jgi:presenilin 1
MSSPSSPPPEGHPPEEGGPPRGEERVEEEVNDLSIEELLYSSSSFHAIATPVSITMILSALCVVYINTEDTIQQGEAALSAAYEAFDNTAGGNATTAETVGISLVNALIIVTAIGAMTFVIVLLYKYRCMWLLLGYMVFASAMLLGVLGAVMFGVAIDKYELDIDQFSFYFTLWNFAAVGTAAIFWQKGIPMFVTQGYLIATSVILAWQLSHFDEWTSWTLLIMLALYDLCAVLTPCGPLKALVALMQSDDAPQMPGLLYEAELPREARRPGTGRRRTSAAATETSGTVEEPSPASTEEPVDVAAGVEEQPSDVAAIEDPPLGPPPTGMLPLAIAKLYKLPLTEPVEPRRQNSFTPLLEEDEVNETASTPNNDSLAQQYSVEQLVAEVEAIFPRGGGYINRVINGSGNVRYVVKDRHGETKRILTVNQETGRVMEERRRSDEDDDDEDDKNNSIKLGLGDFIFYSVLVSKAVQQSFTAFASCFLVVLAGLGGTLILLAVYRHALPALPISIFLGVVFYLLTRLLIEPWIQNLFQNPLYV